MRRAQLVEPLKTFLLLITVTGCMPMFGPMTATPTFLEVNKGSDVTVRVVIRDPNFISGTAILEIDRNGQVETLGPFRDDGQGGDIKANDGDLTFLIKNLTETKVGKIRLRVWASFKEILGERTFSRQIALPVGVLVEAGSEAEIHGPLEAGLTLKIPQDSTTTDALVSIDRGTRSQLENSEGDMLLVETVEIFFQNVGSGSGEPLRKPLQLTVVKDKIGIEGKNGFVVAQKVCTHPLDDRFKDGMTGLCRDKGLQAGLVPLDTAKAFKDPTTKNISIKTAAEKTDELSPDFPGILSGGIFALLQETGSGNITGIVRDAAGVTRPGVVVGSLKEPLVSITDENGRYRLFINATKVDLTARDAFRCAEGSRNGLAVPGIQDYNITLNPLAPASFIPLRPGVRNGGFEQGKLTCWSPSKTVTLIQSFKTTMTASGVITPEEGVWMAALTQDTNSDSAPRLTQTLIVPKGAQALRFDYIFVAEPDGPDDQNANDSVKAEITGISSFTDSFRNAAGQWRQGNLDVSGLWGKTITVQFTLEGSADNRTGNLTTLFLDNLRFATVVVDVKIIGCPGGGSTGMCLAIPEGNKSAIADATRIQQEVRDANEILSQAGLNVQVGRITTSVENSKLNDQNLLMVNYKPPKNSNQYCHPYISSPLTNLLGLERSATGLNLYFVSSLYSWPPPTPPTLPKPPGLAGLTVGPDDYIKPDDTLLDPLKDSGIILANQQGNIYYKKIEILAHEIGHLLIHPDCAQEALEHPIPDGANILHEPRQSGLSRVNMDPEQASHIYMGKDPTTPQPSPWLQE